MERISKLLEELCVYQNDLALWKWATEATNRILELEQHIKELQDALRLKADQF